MHFHCLSLDRGLLASVLSAVKGVVMLVTPWNLPIMGSDGGQARWPDGDQAVDSGLLCYRRAPQPHPLRGGLQ